MKINRIFPDKHKYLQITDCIAKKPKTLYYRGTLPETRLPSVAIVGTRKPSAYGKEIAHRLSTELAKEGIVIISGLALGIDGIAHRACLQTGGKTIAVLGNSVDHIYPRNHLGLAEQIIEQGGAVLSEYEPPTEARNYHFLERNRIVSGLADIVVIVEAAARSGTLNTASHAIEQGKHLFAVPGNITSPLSSGCNALIRQGAQPLLSPRDILDILLPQKTARQGALPLTSSPLEAKIITLIEQGIRDGDEIQQQLGVSAQEFSQTLTLMEITGIIRGLGANQWTLN
ncbi:MAG TPA: DNA-processing protein DprA [Candidatus Saccharimonadales bacterium]|nr:DNA-processing protein DprA [Candidatus Saccharimonadales bacterium]